MAKEKFHTRMYTANADGTDLYVLDPSGNTSHFIWRDPDAVCAMDAANREKGGLLSASRSYAGN